MCWIKYKLVNIWTIEVPISIGQIILIRIYWSGTDLINKQKKDQQLTINNGTINNNNGTINNNITYVQLGNEDLVNVLTKSEKRCILNRKALGINDLVELIHCSGKYKEFMNVYITNL